MKEEPERKKEKSEYSTGILNPNIHNSRRRDSVL
jgi:hypothetical protein